MPPLKCVYTVYWSNSIPLSICSNHNNENKLYQPFICPHDFQTSECWIQNCILIKMWLSVPLGKSRLHTEHHWNSDHQSRHQHLGIHHVWHGQLPAVGQHHCRTLKDIRHCFEGPGKPGCISLKFILKDSLKDWNAFRHTGLTCQDSENVASGDRAQCNHKNWGHFFYILSEIWSHL